MHGRQDRGTSGTWLNRLLWFVALWLVGVATLAAVGLLIRAVLV
jgi:hypothetical protein